MWSDSRSDRSNYKKISPVNLGYDNAWKFASLSTQWIGGESQPALEIEPLFCGQTICTIVTITNILVAKLRIVLFDMTHPVFV